MTKKGPPKILYGPIPPHNGKFIQSFRERGILEYDGVRRVSGLRRKLQWDVWISVGSSTEKARSLRNPKTRRTSSYVWRFREYHIFEELSFLMSKTKKEEWDFFTNLQSSKINMFGSRYVKWIRIHSPVSLYTTG